MTRSKRRRNRATLAVDLAELDAIITALVRNWGGDLDPGLLAYLSTKRENLRKRIGAETENPHRCSNDCDHAVRAVDSRNQPYQGSRPVGE